MANMGCSTFAHGSTGDCDSLESMIRRSMAVWKEVLRRLEEPLTPEETRAAGHPTPPVLRLVKKEDREALEATA